MLHSTQFSWAKFHQVPVVGIIRGLSRRTIEEVVAAYIESGFTTIEITMNTPDVLPIIKGLRKTYSDLNVGAGTVCSLDDFEKAVDVGAQFIVTPVLEEIVITKSVEMGVPIFPGAFTPTEIYKAWKLGASAVKVFPATHLGVNYIKDVLAPLDQLKLIPTGGVNAENISNFFKVGAFGVGMGGSLFPKDLILNQEFQLLRNHLSQLKSRLEGIVPNFS